VNNEIVVDTKDGGASIALLADKKLVEFNKIDKDFAFGVGDIYLGKVRKIMPGLNAAFVDVGSDKDAFIHYLDLSRRFATMTKFTNVILNEKKIPEISNFSAKKELLKDGQISDNLSVGQEILVQIVKESISTKGPRLTTEISLAGRYLVLIPFSDSISVSQKIKSKAERNRLRQLMVSILPQGFGLIIRTVAEGKMVAELDGELRLLLRRWNDALTKISRNGSPKLLLSEMDRSVSIIRDLFSPDYHAIHVNDKDTFQEIYDYVSLISPEQKDIVKLYDGDLPIFDYFNVTKQLKSSLGRVVSVKNGAYLVIEHTEALHVIDVNSGNRFRPEEGQEAVALEVNMLAAEEIARQLRLRDIGGIIVIDFIDMEKVANRQALYEKMCELMKPDRARHNILPLSKFGLMQITRHRVRQAIKIQTEEVCPTCMGKGKCQPSILFVESLEEKIDFLRNVQNQKKMTLQVHPYVYAYINKGFYSLKWRWRMKYGFGLKIMPIQDFSFLQYKFFDAKRNEIELSVETEEKEINSENF